jgi:hypothetical protein
MRRSRCLPLLLLLLLLVDGLVQAAAYTGLLQVLLHPVQLLPGSASLLRCCCLAHSQLLQEGGLARKVSAHGLLHK